MTAKPLVVVIDPLSWVLEFDYDVEAELLAAEGVELVVPDAPERSDSLLGSASVVITTGLTPLTADVITRLTSCVGIVAAQAGLDHIDLEAADKAALAVANVDVGTEEEADHAMALALSALRGIVSLNTTVDQRECDPLRVAQGSELRRIRGQVLGVIGLGAVGRAVVTRAKSFGFEILTTTRSPSLETAEDIAIVPIDMLLALSDVVVVCADADSASVRLLDSHAFERMKDGVVVVNTSRSSLVDEAALEAAIGQGKVSWAALDVRDPKPPGPGDPLTGHPRVIQTLHVAGVSVEARAQLHEMTAHRVLEMLRESGLISTPFSRPEQTFDLEKIHHLDEFEDIARGRLPGSTYGYVAGGAGQERSVHRNRESLDSLLLVPRVMRDVEGISMTTPIFGAASAFPLIVAPSAVQRLSHPDGELATARATRQAGLTMILSMNASTAMEDVAKVGVDFWMQLYFSSDRGHMKSLLRRAESAGAGALCVTVDNAGMPTRLRELHDPLVIPPEVEFMHLAKEPTRRGIDRTITWDVIEWVRGVTTLPIVLKGVVHPEDGRIASEMGVDGLVVSNHGGRQLDGAVSAYDVLVPFLEAVDGRSEVFADGGIRSGPDLLKVLALGARAGLIGRPIWWGLASAGEPGVARVLELMVSELEETMRLCGVSALEEISREILLGFDAG